MRALPAALFAAIALACSIPGPVQAGSGNPALENERQCPALEQSLDAIGRNALTLGAPGLAVGISRRGQPPVMGAWGHADLEHDVPLTADGVFRIASLSKQFTAALVLQLAEQDLVDLSAPAATYLPERSWLGEITVYQLLVQTSGLPDYAQDPSGEAGKAAEKSPVEMLDWIGRLAAMPDFAPGERWAYSNSNYVVLGALVERVTGQSFEEALKARILTPAGMGSTAVDDPGEIVPHRVRGYSRRSPELGALANAAWIHPSMPGPAGSLRSTAGDLLRWNEALYARSLLTDEGLAEMTAPGRLADGRTTRYGMPLAWQEGLKADYAMGLFVSGSELGPRLWHSGDIDGFSTWMAHYPEAGVTIVILLNGDFLDLPHPEVEQIVVEDLRCHS